MADKIFICSKDECKIGFQKYSYLKSHYMGKHPGETTPPEEECGVDNLPDGYNLRSTKADQKPVPASNTAKPPEQPEKVRENPPPAPPPAQDTVYKSESDSSKILEKIMRGFPGLKPEVVTEVLSYAEYYGTLHPSDVRYYLNMMEGVSKNTADLVSHKYGLALQKAASEGNPSIRSTVSNWQFGQQSPNDSPPFMMPGQMFPQQPFNHTGMPPLQYGVPYQQPTYPNFQGYPYYAQPPHAQPPPQEAPHDNPELEARFNAVNEAVAGLTNLVQTLSAQILQTEEQKREEALNLRIESIEKAILQLANAPRTDENANAVAEAIKEVQMQVAAMREETTANKISSLENQISTLTEALSQNKENELAILRNQVDELKRTASEKPPVTGRTEMDVVADLANKAIDKVGEAGKDVRAVILRQATQQDYDPLRNSTQDRVIKGNKIAALVEHEATVQDKENQFLIQ